MEQPFKFLTTVRIKQLLNSVREYDSWGVNKKPPQVGEVGALIDILSSPERPDKYVVENVSKDGSPVWLAEFFAEELEIVHF